MTMPSSEITIINIQRKCKQKSILCLFREVTRHQRCQSHSTRGAFDIYW